MPERPWVHAASTYRVREQERTCALCGERIQPWEGFHEEQNEAFGGTPLPVHDECSPEQNGPERQRRDPR